MQTMTTTRLGRTGLEVSRLCLGCMSFGEPERGNHPWTMGAAASRPFIKKALDLGINFFDTANVYSDGTSEEIVGKALLDYARRDEVVIATKVHGRMHPGPNGAGLSRKAIFAAIDASLKRLGTDHVDLYQTHRWDHGVPIEETLEALNDVVRAGKALYIGASSMHAWQFAKALALSERHGWARFQTMQNYVNLLYREEEREMLPLCRAEGIGVIPWSPLARGRLTRDWDSPYRPRRDRRLRQVALRQDRRGRPHGGGGGGRGRRPARPAPRPGGAGLGAADGRGVGADRRRHPPGAARRRRRRARARALAGGHRRARGAVRAARRGRPRLTRRRGGARIAARLPLSAGRRK